MSSSFPRLVIAFLLLALLVVSWWVTSEVSERRGLQETASTLAFASETVTGDDLYVSLMDVIASSLQHIKDQAGLSASSTESTAEDVAATSSAPAVTTPPVDLAEAIVNIYCQYETDEYRRMVSGTGFLVSAQGAVLTNAHVAQYLLLEGDPKIKDASCQVRTGKEAETTYTARLLYISPSFVIQHAEKIASSSPRGTGENDFALLYIEDGVDGTKITDKFAYIPPSTNPLQAEMKGRTVIVVGYPSEENRAIETQTRSIATSTITEIYTFESGLADIFSLSESRLGHQGSSGGPVIDHLGRAIGVITTKDEGTTALNAITTAYIDRSMRDETGFDLMSTLQGNMAYRARLFGVTVAPILRELLVEAID